MTSPNRLIRLLSTLAVCLRSRRARLAVSVLFGIGVTVVAALAVRHFIRTGWPLAQADAGLVAEGDQLHAATPKRRAAARAYTLLIFTNPSMSRFSPSFGSKSPLEVP